MATKMKGIYKGFKYISHLFVVKEHEMEIGYPTDVKHVAHIGWDCPGSSPSWMNEFKTGPDFSVPSMGNMGQARGPSSNAVSPWSSNDFEQPMGQHPPITQVFKDLPPSDLPKAPRKQKRKKSKPTSSPKASPSSRSRAAKFKAKYAEADAVSNL